MVNIGARILSTLFSHNILKTLPCSHLIHSKIVTLLSQCCEEGPPTIEQHKPSKIPVRPNGPAPIAIFPQKCDINPSLPWSESYLKLMVSAFNLQMCIKFVFLTQV